MTFFPEKDQTLRFALHLLLSSLYMLYTNESLPAWLPPPLAFFTYYYLFGDRFPGHHVKITSPSLTPMMSPYNCLIMILPVLPYKFIFPKIPLASLRYLCRILFKSVLPCKFSSLSFLIYIFLTSFQLL